MCHKKSQTTFFFFVVCFVSPQFILQKSNGLFQRKLIIFQGSRGGPAYGVSNIFLQGGVQLLIPERNPYNLCCVFPGGSDTPCPPLNPRM